MIHFLIDAIVIGNRIIDSITPSVEHPMFRRLVLTLIGLLVMVPTAFVTGYFLFTADAFWWSYVVSFCVVVVAACVMTIGALIAVKD